MRTTDNRFYVYEHLRSDTGAVFYVGKGTGKRWHFDNCKEKT